MMTNMIIFINIPLFFSVYRRNMKDKFSFIRLRFTDLNSFQRPS